MRNTCRRALALAVATVAAMCFLVVPAGTQVRPMLELHEPGYGDVHSGQPGTMVHIVDAATPPEGTRYETDGGAYLTINATTGEARFYVPDYAADGATWQRRITIVYPDTSRRSVDVSVVADVDNEL